MLFLWPISNIYFFIKTVLKEFLWVYIKHKKEKEMITKTKISRILKSKQLKEI